MECIDKWLKIATFGGDVSLFQESIDTKIDARYKRPMYIFVCSRVELNAQKISKQAEDNFKYIYLYNVCAYMKKDLF